MGKGELPNDWGERRDWGREEEKALSGAMESCLMLPLLTAEKRRSRMSRDSDDGESFTSQWIYRFL
jgi:hypothetical protein